MRSESREQAYERERQAAKVVDLKSPRNNSQPRHLCQK